MIKRTRTVPRAAPRVPLKLISTTTMPKPTLKDHFIDIVKGAIGAAIIGAAMSLLQFLGAHIPDMLDWLGSASGGVAMIKATRYMRV